MSPDILTVRGLAALLGLGRNTIYDACARNEIPHRRVGRAIRFSRAAILAWLGKASHANVESWSTQDAKEGQ